MRGDWNSSRFTVSRTELSAHLAVAADALWAGYRGELRRYPLRALAACDRDGRGSELQLRFRTATGQLFQAFRFPRRAECEEWHALLRGLADGLAQDPSASDEWPEVIPVVLLPNAPDVSHQPTGEVECRDVSGDRARFELQLRAALAGADAVANVREERLPEPGQAAYRISGTAIRAAEPDGRRELRARWCATRVAQLSLSMLVLVGVSFVLTLLVSCSLLWLSRTGHGFPPGATGPIGALLVDMAIVIAVIHAWPFALAAVTRWLRWPELLRPAGLAVLLLGAKPLADWLGAAAAGTTPGSWTSNDFILRRVGDLINLSVLAFCWFLCLAAWRAHRQFRTLVPDASRLLPPARRRAEGGMAAVTVAFGALACGLLGWSQYTAANAFALPGRDAWKEHRAVVTYQEGNMKRENLPGAERDFRRALALWEELIDAPSNKPEHQHNLAATQQNLGIVLLWQGQMAEGLASLRQAIASYDRITDEFPEYRSHRRGRAMASGMLDEVEGMAPRFEDGAEAVAGQRLEREGRHGAVVDHYRQTVARHEAKRKEFADPDIYRRLLAHKQNRLAWALATSPDERVRDPKQAVEVARKAVENFPDDGAIWNTLGAAHYRAGDWQECARAVEKSLELSPLNQGFDWLFLAMANYRMGKPDEAKRWLGQAEAWVARLDARKFRHPQEEALWLSQRGDCLRLRDEAEQLIRGEKKGGK
jgi:tetratricopeptide (TPR) repeat protein